jgi:predicted RNA binding protein YcfA (HicA-like mRNA interferase family)
MSPSLPAVNARQVLAALRRAGFVLDRITGSHHVLVHASDARRAVTVPFHGARSLKPGTLRNIIRQAGLTVEEFRSLLWDSNLRALHVSGYQSRNGIVEPRTSGWGGAGSALKLPHLPMLALINREMTASFANSICGHGPTMR